MQAVQQLHVRIAQSSLYCGFPLVSLIASVADHLIKTRLQGLCGLVTIVSLLLCFPKSGGFARIR